jgi:hypothetical protein
MNERDRGVCEATEFHIAYLCSSIGPALSRIRNVEMESGLE